MLQRPVANVQGTHYPVPKQSTSPAYQAHVTSAMPQGTVQPLCPQLPLASRLDILPISDIPSEASDKT